ncbi:DsrE family protein [Oceaniglobus roseus]|uniref:DsrE family protein n=1 Tax=Oceaniglobus roseus TaxID=1737570 RepID=UPI001C12BB6C|nr:DsrE family protein [Kandeliimicrobium roseum]
MKAFVTAALIGMLATGAFAEGKAHKLAIHVDENDPQVMNMALNNAANVASYYREQGDTVTIEIVTYGPGLHMVMADSPVADRIAAMSLETEGMSFAACANTMDGMEKKTGKKPELLDEAKVVPSGVVRLIELQEDGYSYVRP